MTRGQRDISHRFACTLSITIACCIAWMAAPGRTVAQAVSGTVRTDATDEPYDLHVMILSDARLVGRDNALWRLGGGARVFLGSRKAYTAVGAMLGFRSLAFWRGNESWINREALMAYDIAVGAETRWGREEPWHLGVIVGGHAGVAFVPATKMRAVRTTRVLDEGAPVGRTVTSESGAVCVDDICRLDRSYNFGMSVGARLGGRLTLGDHRDITLQLGLDARAPVRASADIDLVLLLGFASY